MRGKEVVHDQKDLHGGITPAYAGKSDFHDAHLRFFEDHPRLCGEKRIVQRYFVHSAGSPPPMRGKGLNRATRPTTCTDHPRLCGEKFILAVNVTLYSGITPAYAGKSMVIIP